MSLCFCSLFCLTGCGHAAITLFLSFITRFHHSNPPSSPPSHPAVANSSCHRRLLLIKVRKANYENEVSESRGRWMYFSMHGKSFAMAKESSTGGEGGENRGGYEPSVTPPEKTFCFVGCQSHRHIRYAG